MGWQIVTTHNFDRQYARKSEKIKNAFDSRLEALLLDLRHPLLHVHKLSGPFADCRSFNVSSDVRVIFKKIEKDRTLLLIAIGTHSELYS